MTTRQFPYRIDWRWKPMFLLLGVKDTDGVDITDDGRLIATYGRFTLETTVDNVRETSITGPHRWWTAVGLRLSLTDDGLTMSTNHHRGLCINFVEKVPPVIGTSKHSALWVSVAEPEALAAALEA